MIPRERKQPLVPPATTEAEQNRRERDYAVYPLIPRREITLISGPNRVGKTSLLLTLAEDWRNGKPVFGYPSYPDECAYVCLSHTRAHMQRIADRIGASLDDLNFTCPALGAKTLEFPKTCEAVRKKTPNVKTIFLDGVHLFAPQNTNDYQAAVRTIASIQETLENYELTLIATGRTIKYNKELGNGRPMDRFYGSTGTTERIATFIGIEFTSEDLAAPYRQVVIESQLLPTLVQKWSFAEPGTFVPQNELATENRQSTDAQQSFETLIMATEPGVEFNFSDWAEIAVLLDVHERTIQRYAKKMVESGTHLQKLEHNRWVRSREQ